MKYPELQEIRKEGAMPIGIPVPGEIWAELIIRPNEIHPKIILEPEGTPGLPPKDHEEPYCFITEKHLPIMMKDNPDEPVVKKVPFLHMQRLIYIPQWEYYLFRDPVLVTEVNRSTKMITFKRVQNNGELKNLTSTMNLQIFLRGRPAEEKNKSIPRYLFVGKAEEIFFPELKRSLSY